MYLELLTIGVPIIACVQLAHAVNHARLSKFLVSAGFWVAASILTATFFPQVTYYDHGPLAAAGLFTGPFIGAAALAVVSIYLCSAIGLSRKLYLPPVVMLVLLVAHSGSWIA